MRHHTDKPGRVFADMVNSEPYDAAKAFAALQVNAADLDLFADSEHSALIAALQAEREKLITEAASHGQFFC